MGNAERAMVIEDTRRWLERAVIGLNLCPFAKAAHVRGLVHYAVSRAADEPALLEELAVELDALASCSAAERETTLLVVPHMFENFPDFNDFMGRAERLLRRRKLEGVIQLASFHPRFQFAGTAPEDVTNCTNRSPYPVVHLLREESIDSAVEAFPEAEAIYEANMRTMEALGHEGWEELGVGRST